MGNKTKLRQPNAIPTKQDVENWEKKEKEKGNDKKKSPVKK